MKEILKELIQAIYALTQELHTHNHSYGGCSNRIYKNQTYIGGNDGDIAGGGQG